MAAMQCCRWELEALPKHSGKLLMLAFFVLWQQAAQAELLQEYMPLLVPIITALYFERDEVNFLPTEASNRQLQHVSALGSDAGTAGGHESAQPPCSCCEH